MYCKNCQSEEEFIRIGGKIYCSNCSNIIKDEGDKQKLKQKVPQFEAGTNIRTDKPKHEEVEISNEAKKIEKTLPHKKQSKDELGKSAILLDILSDNAQKLKDEESIKKDENLVEASNEVLDKLPQKPKNNQNKKDQLIRDVKPKPVPKTKNDKGSIQYLNKFQEQKLNQGNQDNKSKESQTKDSNQKANQPTQQNQQQVKSIKLNEGSPEKSKEPINEKGFVKENEVLILLLIITLGLLGLTFWLILTPVF